MPDADAIHSVSGDDPVGKHLTSGHMTPPPSPRRRKLRMLRDGDLPEDDMLLIRAAPATVDETVLDIAETALDSADTYVVEGPDGQPVALYGVSVFIRPQGSAPAVLLRRFAGSPFYLEASVREIRASGFDLLATGAKPDHFDVLLVSDRIPTEPLLSLAEIEDAARRLVEACGELHPNPSYAGRRHG